LKIIDTSDANHILLAQFSGGGVVNSVSSDKLPAWFQDYLPGLVEKIRIKEAT
jgi:hypothetical protein